MLERLVWEKQFNTIKNGYEKLCLHPCFILRKVCVFVGLKLAEEVLDPSNSNAKIGIGNPMS